MLFRSRRLHLPGDYAHSAFGTGDMSKVLVIEDDIGLAMALADTLRYMGIDVVGPVHDLQSAQRAIDQEKCDAALVDVDLTGESAVELVEYLERKNISFAFMSGLADQLPVQLAARYRCVDKGTIVEDLAAEVDRLLHKVHT